MPNSEMSWRDAIEQVLSEAEGAMHYSEIAEQVVSQDLRVNVGATPANTVGALISSDIKDNGSTSIFRRVAVGEYMLNEGLPDGPAPAPQIADEESERAVIQAFGMFWQRELVHWSSSPEIRGEQTHGAATVDMGDQRGVYLLHDRDTCVYVGRAIDNGIGKRLYAHTRDRLAGRWNRFSWFGLCEVTEEGQVHELPVDELFDASAIITIMEGILMEALEAPQNRRQGDGFKGIEYLQVVDDELKKNELKGLMMSMLKEM